MEVSSCTHCFEGQGETNEKWEAGQKKTKTQSQPNNKTKENSQPVVNFELN